MTDVQKQILSALNHLNWNYGKGDISQVGFRIGRAYRSIRNCKGDSFKFRVRGNSVFALGHQRKFRQEN